MEPPDKDIAGLFISGIVVAITGNTIPVFIWLPIFTVQPGSIIIPMQETANALVAFVITVLAGGIIGSKLISKERCTAGLAIIALSITPLFVNWLAAGCFAAIQNVYFEN